MTMKWMTAGLLISASMAAQNGAGMPDMSMLWAIPETVLNQPYTVVEKTTTTRTLADGTSIVHRSEERKWRDAQGRFRKQVGQVNEKGDAIFRTVEIFDPVAHTLTRLTLERKVAVVMHTPELTGEQERKFAAQYEKQMSEPMALEGVRVKTEELPPKTIAGIYGVGKRTTRVRPPGTVHNDREIVSVSERYDSPDLKILLYSTLDDPRQKMVREVTSAERREPDASSFQVPADFTVKDVPLKRP